jgi:UDP-N-acetylglucosamine 1-carboxyvinyltransferase
MDSFKIIGQKKLSGSIYVSGAKNAVLPIMTAAILAKGKTTLYNVPVLNDIKMMAHLLRIIGARVDFADNIMTIDSTNCNYYEAPYELVSKMRASIYVLGPLLARFKNARVSFPGGCAIGSRPVDLHLSAMERLGTEIELKHGYILASTKGLTGGEIEFKKVSVGATANALMAAVLAKGETIIKNAAKEPEIGALIDFLNKMGAQIKGRGSDLLHIYGVDKLEAVEMEMIPDRIEAGTFLIAGAITNSEIDVINCKTEHLKSFIDKLEETGCKVVDIPNGARIIPPEKLKGTDIETQPYPGFPTDLQAQFMALMCLAEGKSEITETIFPDRFMHVAELRRLNANIEKELNKAHVYGVKELQGANVMATDLRASAALVLAGLAAKGETNISRIYHIDRGYERIENKLKKIGADITRIEG